MYFYIKVGKKDKEHEHYQEGSLSCYVINETPTPVLILQRNKEYTFEVNAEGHPLVLTLSEEGGTLEGSFSTPFDKGKLTFIVPNNMPSNGYYQCAKHKYMGGKYKILE